MEENKATEPEETTEGQVTQQTAVINKPSKGHAIKNIFTILLVLLLLSAAPAAYYHRDSRAKSDLAKKQNEIAELQKKIADHEAEESTATDDTASDAETAKTPSAATIASIKDSISSGNTAALEGYMASTVKVILAASEGIGDRTPTEAIADLKYLDDATDPWNFNLPAAELTSYSTGDYKAYFPASAVVGKSANDFVVSFTFNSAGKISGIFMAANADLL